MNENTLTVSQLTYTIKNLLETRFLNIKVQGEITNLRHQSSGHIYFTLKDKDSQISCVLFKGAAKSVNTTLNSGDSVIVEGEITVYPPRGNYQIIVRKLTPSGVGDLLLKLHQLKEKLKLKGWFNPALKKALPKLPKRIGIVTSPTGAVIQDVLNVLKRRFANFNLILNPVKVQGDNACTEIAQAINDFNKYNLADVLIIGRGGGSLEDLWPFNEEIVAKAIFESKIPIISAVGHETDYTIADFVADIRAPTPSAAAEIVISEKTELIKTLENYSQAIQKNLFHLILGYKKDLHFFKKHPLFSSYELLLSEKWQMFDEIKNQIDLSIKQKFEKLNSIFFAAKKESNALSPIMQFSFAKQKLENFSNNLKISWNNLFKSKTDNFKKIQELINTLNPNNLLKKGYSILFSEKDNSIILSTKQLSEGEKVIAQISDGKIKATIEKVEN